MGLPVPSSDRLEARLPSDIGIVLAAHGDVPLEVARASNGMMKKAEELIEEWSEQVRDWPRNEENDPLWHDTLILVDRMRMDGGRDNFEPGNLEFASPTIEDALKKVVSRGAGFLDRSSHTLIDIPEAIASLQDKYPDIKMEYVAPDMGLICEDLADIILSKVYDDIKG